jgi:hypothetical protein
MSSEDQRFDQILDSLAAKEKRAQKRAALLTALTLFVGLLLMAILSYGIVGLRATRARLEQEVNTLELRKKALEREVDHIRANAEQQNAMAQQALEAVDVQKLGASAQAKVNGALSSLKDTKDDSDVPNKRPTPETVKPDKPIPEITTRTPRFISNLEYQGYDKTRIILTITPQAAKTPRTLFTYAIDGKNYFDTPPDRTISFVLDKSKRNPSKLILFLDFVKDEPGGYDILIRTSDGNQRRFTVSPPKSGQEKQVYFSFAVL